MGILPAVKSLIKINWTTPTSFFIILFLLSCSPQNDKTLSGYIEGEYTYIGSGISGTLFSLNVSRGQTVTKNTLLFTLDPEPDRSAMEAAKSNVGELEAQVNLAKIELRRYSDLEQHNAVDQNTLDEKQTDYDRKLKQLEGARKTLQQTSWAYQQKMVYAPVAGYIYDTFYRVGEKVVANQPVLAILAPENIKVLFYIPEDKLSTIQLGETIAFDCDGCSHQTKAKITYISSEAEYTPPIIYSKDTRYKLVYLIRADLPPSIANHFNPGQPVDVYIHEK